ncbi:HlyD family efflux transporter periplasmic adaptor subunit [Pseudooctadecabacter jejudonensis]|uniref:Type I secretion system membrane fusion protein PrsE n=1 Tax=Pseudooctadecabacter jejudonensis TaxID=1391910 RepID=A0A1Y5RLI8_9RHOB|nr:HlyD family efflux transporter periplasmic adaptor subunit [Pseudooctadecabacter jejudonensis]SLN19212.1 Type I secretion system membrane fusion protein PrsE [Pseudooctadecabacter jejudonensis]
MVTIADEFEARVKGPSLLIWLIGATVVIFLIWAKFAAIDEIVRAKGSVVSSSRPQIIQNLEGGILAELLVSEGDQVEPGDVLARLRGTQFETSVTDLREQVIAAEIRRLRLEAEIEGMFNFDVPDAIEQFSPEMVASERALLGARQSDYVSRTEGAQAIITETSRELAVMEDLYNREIAALIEVTRARKANSDATNAYNEIVTQAELQRASEYSEVLSMMATLKQDLRVAEDRLERTVITSPMRGIVNNLGVTTIGGVIRPGEEIFQIIPLDDELFVEAEVAPSNIANVVPGQTATIKLSAYDYTIYGSLSGEVHLISADTFEDERDPNAPPHYRVTLRVDTTNLGERQQRIEIRPGMQADVELHTGSKTVLQYLTKPLYRSQEALREP